MNATRVLHVINTAEVGGGGEHLLHLTRTLEPHGFRSTVVVGRDGPTTARLRDAGVPVVIIGRLGLAAPVILARLLRSTRPDILHLHGSRSGLTGIIAARLARMHRVVYTAHAFAFHRRLPSLVRFAAAKAEALTCHNCERVICLTEGDRQAAVRYGIAAQRLTVIPNGIDVTRFASVTNCRDEFGFTASQPVVGMVARLVPQKDPISFVNTARRIADALPSAAFLLVGDGMLRPAVERQVADLDLAGRFLLTGFRPDIANLLQTMDVVVLTSLWEGLPIAVLEALASAKPVAAFALPGLLDVISDGEEGVLVPDRDVARLADQVVRLLRNPIQRESMGRQGRQRVEQCFTVSRMAESTATLYATMVDRPSPIAVAQTTSKT